MFLDRDGTINEDRGYVHRLEDLHFLPGAAEALRRLRGADWRIVVVTNQSGVGRGYYNEEQVRIFHQAFNERLRSQGAEIDAFYYCPHHPDAGCRCRKPALGMFEQACRDFPVDVSRSFMIGDKREDMEFAAAAGLRGVRIVAQPESASEATTLLAAVEQVLSG
jgi:D-glycero-D-manno-heptose 1,7-bisphosphate phosphatase